MNSFILAIWLSFIAPYMPVQEHILYVTVWYDTNNDGKWEGVGPGVPVYIREAGSQTEFFNITNQNSTAGFYVDQKTYVVEATPPQTRLFFTWVCQGNKLIDEPVEYLILQCVERFFIRFPFLDGGK